MARPYWTKPYWTIEYAVRFGIGRVLCWTGRHNDTCPRGTSKAMRHFTTGRRVRWSPISWRHGEYLRKRWASWYGGRV